jgi:hypothetical protein
MTKMDIFRKSFSGTGNSSGNASVFRVKDEIAPHSIWFEWDGKLR